MGHLRCCYNRLVTNHPYDTMDPWPLSEKVQITFQIIDISAAVTLPFKRYDWIHRDMEKSCKRKPCPISMVDLSIGFHRFLYVYQVGDIILYYHQKNTYQSNHTQTILKP